MTDPSKEINKNEIFASSSFDFNVCQQSNPTSILQEDRLVGFSYLIHNFLKTHLSFWEDVIILMENLNQSSQVLSKKG